MYRIEVPNNIERTITVNDAQKTISLAEATTNEEIAEWLEVYAGKGINADYTKGSSGQNGSSWKEEWYDFYNATWEGESEYAYIGVSTTSVENINAYYPFNKWEEYYGTGNVYTSTSKDVNGTMTLVDFSEGYSNTAYYFVKAKDNATFQNRSDGCGLTYSEYQETYSKMLQSIKKYGGFWLAQYEAGIAYEEEGKTATNRTWGNYKDTLYKPSKTAKYSTMKVHLI